MLQCPVFPSVPSLLTVERHLLLAAHHFCVHRSLTHGHAAARLTSMQAGAGRLVASRLRLHKLESVTILILSSVHCRWPPLFADQIGCSLSTSFQFRVPIALFCARVSAVPAHAIPLHLNRSDSLFSSRRPRHGREFTVTVASPL